VKSLPLVARVAVIAVVVLALVDHLGPGFVLGGRRGPAGGSCDTMRA
jgi:hypothetical protein